MKKEFSSTEKCQNCGNEVSEYVVQWKAHLELVRLRCLPCGFSRQVIAERKLSDRIRAVEQERAKVHSDFRIAKDALLKSLAPRVYGELSAAEKRLADALIDKRERVESEFGTYQDGKP